MGLAIGELHPELIAAYKKVAKAAKNSGKTLGIDLASMSYLPTYMELGFRFFTHGADTSYLINGSQDACQVARQKAAEIEGKT
jgi:2,4-dihydroxyhept-2-ene-1,7-dioic acid aldolase